MEIQNVSLSSLSVDGKGSYGIGASAVEFSEKLYTYLRITDICDDGTLNMKDLKSVDDEKASLLDCFIVVFERERTMLEMFNQYINTPMGYCIHSSEFHIYTKSIDT